MKIGIIGANGQVGFEVSLLLSQMPDVEVIPIVRSPRNTALLDCCGLTCRVGSVVVSDEEARRLLQGCTLVADFSLPGGLPFEVRRAMRGTVRQCIRHAPSDAAYVFMSTTMAYGMPSDASSYGRWLIARTPYAANKRHAERWTRWLGRLRRRPTYILRLGQVYGEIQASSRQLIAGATTRPIAVHRGEHSTADVVFCSTIALALRNIALGREASGTYTLLEQPEWVWKDVYALHLRQAGIAPQFAQQSLTATTAGMSRLKRLAAAVLMRTASRHKDFVVGQLLPLSEGLGWRLKARHLVHRASAEIAAREQALEVRPYKGPVPGKRLRSISDSWNSMQPELMAVRRLLHEKLGPKSHNFSL